MKKKVLQNMVANLDPASLEQTRQEMLKKRIYLMSDDDYQLVLDKLCCLSRTLSTKSEKELVQYIINTLGRISSISEDSTCLEVSNKISELL